MIRQIKNFFSAIIIGIITIILLTYFTIENDNKHAENCKNLGLVCEKGKVEVLRDEIIEEVNHLVKDILPKD